MLNLFTKPLETSTRLVPNFVDSFPRFFLITVDDMLFAILIRFPNPALFSLDLAEKQKYRRLHLDPSEALSICIVSCEYYQSSAAPGQEGCRPAGSLQRTLAGRPASLGYPKHDPAL